MSDLHVRVTTIDAVKEHPNADRLSLAVVGGWQCVVAKDIWQAGDTCVFFPPDTILPEEVSDRFGVTQYLTKGRVKHTRLRGEPSFGLVVKPDQDWPVGTDVADHYGATKWEPPRRQRQGAPGQPRSEDPRFTKYTDIDNLRHFPSIFDGQEVVVTEKIHGANVRLAVIQGKVRAGSRRMERGKPKGGNEPSDDATYWFPLTRYRGLHQYLASFIEPQPWWKRLLRRPGKSKTVIVYGEVFGPSVQSFDYGVPQGHLDFRAFDISVDGVYMDWDNMVAVCREWGIPTVPELGRGFYGAEWVQPLATGPTTVAGTHMREGVVVRTVTEQRHPSLGRMILKFVSDDYLLDKKKTDYAEM